MGERGSLRFEASGDSSGFAQFMRSIAQQAKHATGEINAEVSKSWGGIGKGFLGGIAGALSFEAVKGALENFMAKAKGISDISEQMDMGTDATQRWMKAADELGVSFGVVQSGLSAIASKRQEALSDPEAAELFQRIGIKRSDVLDTQGIDNSKFSQMVLKAGKESPEKKAAVEEIVGRRAADKMMAVADNFERATADISRSAIELAKRVEEVQRKVETGIAVFISSLANVIEELADWMGEVAAMFSMSPANQKAADEEKKRRSRALIAPRKPFHAPTDPDAYDNTEKDKAAEEKRNRLAQLGDRELAAEERIEAAKRQNKTEGERQASNLASLANVRARIEDVGNRKMPSSIEGDLKVREWNVKHKEELADLQVREQDLLRDLRQKPDDIAQNALGKSGLFTASGLAGGDSTPRDILSELKQINRKMDDGGLDRRL